MWGIYFPFSGIGVVINDDMFGAGVTCAVLICVVVVLCLDRICAFRHLPSEKLTEDIIRAIEKNGLIHFTKKDNANAIMCQGLVPGMQKPMSPSEKDMVWFYIFYEGDFWHKLNIVRDKDGRNQYDTVILFQGITREQLEHMNYRKKDMAVVYHGVFRSEIMESYDLTEFDPKQYSNSN